jgi:regulator of RNase E activity RraA
MTMVVEDPHLQVVRAAALRTAVVGDVLDQIGRTSQFLPPSIRPLDPEMTLAGRAMPVVIGDVFGEQDRAFGRLTDALDQLERDEVYMARGGRTPCAAWGEILTATAKVRGAAGAVIDGFHRDTSQVVAQEWPVFSRGAYGQDARVRAAVVDFRAPALYGRVWVNPGDLVIGDVDGVVVIPRDCEAEVLEAAQAKLKSEGLVRAAIERGMSSTQAFKEFGVL